MITAENSFDIVNQSLTGQRAIDQKALVSLDSLSEKLQNLKNSNPIFAGIGFSDYVSDISAMVKAVGV